MIDPHSPATQLTLPLHIPDWLENHALASPAFVWWIMPFMEDGDEQTPTGSSGEGIHR